MIPVLPPSPPPQHTQHRLSFFLPLSCHFLPVWFRAGDSVSRTLVNAETHATNICTHTHTISSPCMTHKYAIHCINKLFYGPSVPAVLILINSSNNLQIAPQICEDQRIVLTLKDFSHLCIMVDIRSHMYGSSRTHTHRHTLLPILIK